jgi:O-antigen ligase
MVAFFSLPIEHPRDRWIKWGGIAGATALILLSTSKTALILGFGMLGLMTFYRNFRWRGKRSVIFASLSALVVGSVTVGVLSNWVAIITGLGKDPTISGRTYIWEVSLDRLWDHPWLGYGRSAFWSPDSPYPRAISFYLSQGFRAPHAHNGFIDTALDVGLIGLGLLLICYVTAFVRALLRAYGSNHPEHLWAIGYLTFFALNNMTESYVLRLSNVFWVLFIATVLTVKQRVPVFDDEHSPLAQPQYNYQKLPETQS